MPQKIDKRARAMAIAMVHENGFAASDEVIEFIRPHYTFDPAAALERELRRYVGQMVRDQRDEHGTRTMFFEKEFMNIMIIPYNSTLFHLITCVLSLISRLNLTVIPDIFLTTLSN